MQVELDDETVEFLQWYAEENDWDVREEVIEDCAYKYSFDIWDESGNLVEMLYRIYTKNTDKFPGAGEDEE